MPKFRKKPVVIEAFRWTGGPDQTDDPVWIVDAMKKPLHVPGAVRIPARSPLALFIYTLEGQMRADVGDWIIQGVKGELYPCKPDIFAATYEPIESCLSG